jgi:hypothetical protein
MSTIAITWLGVLAHEAEVGLDIGTEPAGTNWLGLDPAAPIRLALCQHFRDDLFHQIVFPSEVVQDHTIADLEPLGDAR